MSQIVPPPESDHLTWELEKATLETPPKDPAREGSSSKPSLPDLAFSSDWAPFAAEKLVGTLHLTGDYSHVETPPSLLERVGGSKTLSGRAQSSQR